MSVLDMLSPVAGCKVQVCDICLYIEFARVADPDLIRDLKSNFKGKAGFDFGTGTPCDDRVIDLMINESSGTKFCAVFPSLYNPLDVLAAFKIICQNHGVSVIHEMRPSAAVQIKKFGEVN